MSFLEDIAVITGAYKRYHSNAYIGHFTIEWGNHDYDNGWLPLVSSMKHSVTSYTPCAIILTTTEPFREYDVTYTFNVKTCKRKTVNGEEQYTTSTQSGVTVQKPIYEDDSDSIELEVTIPAWEKAGVSYKLDSTMVYEINSVSVDINTPGMGAVKVYGLASVGSKLVYGLSWNRIMGDLLTISNGMFISPPFCPLCSGTGVYDSGTCPQCNGFMFSGRGAVEYIADKLGQSVGIGRDSSRSFDRFQHEVWAQKWWVTPIVDEIKRFFAHFLDIETTDITITERYDDHEPAWHLLLPTGFGTNSEFSYSNARDRSTIQELMDSISPAGVVSYLTYYSNESGYTDFDVEVNLLDNLSVTPYPGGQWGGEWDCNFAFPPSGHTTTLEEGSGHSPPTKYEYLW